MYRSLACLVLSICVGCGDGILDPAELPNESGAVKHKGGLLALVDPYERTVPYRTYGLFEPLSLSEQQIAGDLESISDSELETVSESIIDGNEEVVYESDGLWVEQQLGISGGDDGGGEDPMFTAAESGTVNCEKQYARNCARCRRVPERRARALCWGLAMAIYAKCRADEEPQ